jgi:hypothetical protein
VTRAAQSAGPTTWNSGADISECGLYRYRLWRDVWPVAPDDHEDSRTCLFVMLNPSTADGVDDDPTIRRCIGFCRRWGYDMLTVVNLFAFRSTKPSGMLGASDPIGPDNDAFIREEAESASRIVLAWGSHTEIKAMLSARAFVVRRMLKDHLHKTVVLGRCKDLSPRHPLMLAYDVEPIGVSP